MSVAMNILHDFTYFYILMDLPKSKKHQTQKQKIKAQKHTTFLLSKVLGDKGEEVLFFFFLCKA